MDGTPYRAHKTYFFTDALSWISLIGGMARPRVNSRSTNFWARIGQFFGRVDDIGSAVSPREQYGVESTPLPDFNLSEIIDTTKYRNWIMESPSFFIDPTRDSVLIIRPTGEQWLYAPFYKENGKVITRKRIPSK